MAEPEEFVFNGIDGASGSYLVPPMTAKEVAALALGKDPDEVQQEAAARYEATRQPSYAPREDVDPKKLEQSGWGVIFPHGSDPAIKDALQPLLDFRREQATKLAEHRFQVFDGPRAYRPKERKNAFLQRQKAPTSGPVDPDRMPYYLLLVGSASEISPEFQAQLDLQHAVGRLCFDSLDQYASYAQSVIASETGKIAVSRRMGMFGVKNDRATNLSAEGLIGGLQRYVGDKLPSWSIDLRVEAQATKAELTKLLGGPETPAVLFTASHGMGFPNGNARQLSHQGALLCQDWEPRPGPVSQDYYFAGEDLTDQARLAGLIAFLFACYGGGTPEHDAFFHRTGRRDAIAPHPFFAQLPTRMLGHPRGGALAVVGHVERAWGCSFHSAKGGHQIAVFESFFKRLLDGHPVGSAMDYFGERYGELSAGLVEKLEELKFGGDVSELDVANDWTANNDARNYLVLGDPAVRVPMVEDADARQRPVLEVASAAASQSAPPVAGAGQPTILPPKPAEDSRGDVDFGIGSLFKGKDAEAADGSSSGSGEGGAVDSLKGFVAKLGTRISAALDDMGTLEVKTYVATELEQVAVQGNQLVGARLRALTRISLDGDMVVCLPERDGELDTTVLEIHERMVQQAQATRAELMKTIVQAAASLVGLIK